MLSEAIIWSVFGIIAISVVFCCCTFGCYVLFQYLLTEVDPDLQPETPVWEAKHYYDPLPLSTPSPPDTICKPTPYSFKLQNGNGVYAASLPHAVINPAVLQYPPGHVLDQQQGTKIVPEGQNLGLYNKTRDRYRLRLFQRRPSTASSEATIYSVHSSEIWSGSGKNTHHGPFIRSPSPSGILRNNPTMFINPSQVRGWTIKEEPEPPEDANDRRKSAPA